MMFSLPIKSANYSGLKRICDIQQASNGWIVTLYKHIEPTADDVKNHLENFSNVMKYFQQNTNQCDEPWKQQDPEEDISITAKNLVESQQQSPVETHLFLDKAELIAFISGLLD